MEHKTMLVHDLEIENTNREGEIKELKNQGILKTITNTLTKNADNSITLNQTIRKLKSDLQQSINHYKHELDTKDKHISTLAKEKETLMKGIRKEKEPHLKEIKEWKTGY